MVDDDVERHARAFVDAYNLHRRGRLYRLRRGTEPALRTLEKVHRLIEKLADAIIDLPPDARLALRKQETDIAAMLDLISSGLNAPIVGAYESLESSDENQKIAPKPHRPPDPVVEAITKRAAQFFEAVKGQKPTRSVDSVSHLAVGNFGRFLTDLFNGLGITASPDAAIQKLMKRRR
jgi:hypothetical protein